MSPESHETHPPVYESCPHCGHPLSPWEKVLLNVDRALMCKHCWYRIMLGARPAGAGEKPHTDHRREQKP